MKKASARHILVDSKEACEDLKSQIEKGADFAKLAKAYSIDIIATLAKPFTFSNFKNILEKYVKKTDRRLKPRQELTVTADELADAIEKNQLLLHYQPQINFETRDIVGVEALVRWQHPKHGLIYPDFFISLAEDNGLSVV